MPKHHDGQDTLLRPVIAPAVTHARKWYPPVWPALLVLLTAVFAYPLHAKAQTTRSAQPDLGGGTLLIDGIRDVRAMATTPEGALLLLERAETTPQNASNIVFGFAETDRTVALGADVPFPPMNPQTPIVALYPAAAVVLPGGDIIATGTVHYSRVGPVSRERALSLKREEKGRLAWAARFTSFGDVVWNFAYPPGAPQWDDFSYFVTQVTAKRVVIGGKTQEGRRACVDRAYGLLIWIDTATGGFSGPGRKTYTAGKTRQGFLDLTHMSNARTLALGWAARKADEAPLESCRDDAWALRVPANGTRPQRAGLWGSNGIDLLTSGLRVPGNRVAVAGLTDIDGQAQRRALLTTISSKTPLEAAMANGGTRVGDATRLTITVQRGIAKFGFSAGDVGTGGLAFGTRSQSGQQSLRAFVYPEHGACSWAATLSTPGNAADVRASDAGTLGDGTVAVAGRARGASGDAWQGFIRWASLSSDLDGLVALGTLAPGQQGQDIRGGTPERAATTYRFDVTSPLHLNATLHPLSGDPDLLLSAKGTESDTLVAISDNSNAAAELISQTLPPGTYTLTVAHPSADVLYALDVAAGPPRGGSDDRTVSLPDNAVTKLQALGFAAPFDAQLPNRRLGAQARSAVKAFQAQICRPVTGQLNASQVQLLTSLPAPPRR